MYGKEVCEDTQLGDVSFLIDASRSIGWKNWNKTKNFMNDIVDNLVVGDDNVSDMNAPEGRFSGNFNGN